jgi:ribosomal protein S24E
MLDKTVKEAHTIDAATGDSHTLHNTVSEKLWKFTDLKEQLVVIWQMKTTCGGTHTRNIHKGYHSR